MRVDRYMYIIIEVLTRINHDTYMSSPASASCANRTDQKGRKKKKKKGRLWTTNANRLQITVNLKKIHHLRRAFRRFCASSHPSYKCFMLENLMFFHNSSKTPDNADIANRKHYSAPAGALTKFSGWTNKLGGPTSGGSWSTKMLGPLMIGDGDWRFMQLDIAVCSFRYCK